jgi:CheY-like chemotaxis protein
VATVRRPRVLVIDDNDEIRRVLREALSRRGCYVAGEAPDGAQALELVRAVECDRIVMDFRMPNLDGASATVAILAAHPGIEVVGFTGGREGVRHMHRAGAARVFPKPAIDALVDHVARPLDVGPNDP